MSLRRLAVMVATLAASVAASLLGGCSTIFPRVEVAETAPPAPAAMPQAQAGSGSIFASGSYRPLFEDHRARLVGDTLTVQIVEKVSATATSTSNIDKTGTIAATVTALPGINPKAFGRAGADASSSNSFAGKGATANTNEFSGTITVVVRGVLPNGHLLIAGEKQIGVNENVDVLRFSGQIDPRAIQPGNTVASAAIANVRLEQRGRGAQSEAQAIGWLGRVFLSLSPF